MRPEPRAPPPSPRDPLRRKVLAISQFFDHSLVDMQLKKREPDRLLPWVRVPTYKGQDEAEAAALNATEEKRVLVQVCFRSELFTSFTSFVIL